MERWFSVLLDGEHAGKVSVQRQGLYYLFSCRCVLSGTDIYRLMVRCENTRENLGILIPEDQCLVLKKKIPVRRIGEGDMSFQLMPKREATPGTFVPIAPEEPFAYISRLKESFLVLRDGQTGIMLEKTQEC